MIWVQAMTFAAGTSQDSMITVTTQLTYPVVWLRASRSPGVSRGRSSGSPAIPVLHHAPVACLYMGDTARSKIDCKTSKHRLEPLVGCRSAQLAGCGIIHSHQFLLHRRHHRHIHSHQCWHWTPVPTSEPARCQCRCPATVVVVAVAKRCNCTRS